MNNQTERFTKKARRGLSLAEAEAQQINHDQIDTEHLLLGLIGEEQGVAVRVLQELHVDLAALKQQTESAHADEARVLGALREGAIGYICKDADPGLLLAAICGAVQGQSILDPTIAGAVLSKLTRGNDPNPKLARREHDVLRQLALGKTNHQIAEALTVSGDTVKTHIGNILTKLHLTHRTQAALYALKHRLVTIDELDL